MRIIEANKEHAQEIGKAVVMAIHPELVLATFNPRSEKEHPIEAYEHLFATLAARDDSQYSFRNTLLALDKLTPDGDEQVIGVIIGYDGERLHKLRQTFIDEASRQLGLKFEEELPDETSPDEFYLDTLAVKPQARDKGVGQSLLRAMIERGHTLTGKPVGLLVDKTNPNARRLYEKVGFRKIEDRPFFDAIMDHMQA